MWAILLALVAIVDSIAIAVSIACVVAKSMDSSLALFTSGCPQPGPPVGACGWDGHCEYWGGGGGGGGSGAGCAKRGWNC